MTLKGDVIAGWTGGVYARMGPIAWGHHRRSMTLKGDVIAGWTGGVYARMGPIAWGHGGHLGFRGITGGQ